MSAVPRERSLASLLPYSAHVTARLVRTHAGDYLQSWRLAGFAFDCADAAEIAARHQRLNGWLRNVASPSLALWSHVIRGRVPATLPAGCAPGFARGLEQKYLARLSTTRLYGNALYLTIVYRPQTAPGVAPLARLLARRDAAAARAAEREALETCATLAREFEAAFAADEPEPLGVITRDGRVASTLVEFLAELVNGAHEPRALPAAPLAEVLGTVRPLFGREAIEYRGATGARLGAMLGFKEYPSPTRPGMLNALLTAPFPFVLTQSFACLAKSAAQGLLSRQYHRMTNAGDLAISQSEQLKLAMDALAGGEFVMGDHHVSLQVLAEPTPDDPRGPLVALDANVALARSALADAGALTAREDLALTSAWLAQLPGNFAARPRRSPITSRNFVALSPFNGFPVGHPDGHHWGDALTVFATRAGSPYYYALHASDPASADGGTRRDIGHTFVCGPTGSGKTVFMGFALAMATRHGATQIVFDKDRGLEILVRALGGTYLAFAPGQPSGCNPLALEPTASNREFLNVWLARLVERPGRALTVREEAELAAALEGVLALPAGSRRLSRLLEFLDPTQPDGPGARLAPWCASTRGELAWAFDCARDEVAATLGSSLGATLGATLASPESVASVCGFDMTHVLDQPRVRGPLTLYLFHRVRERLDGRRTVVWLDEFAKLLSDPAFEAFAKDGLKTWRKRNACAVFATQSASDVLDSPIARTLIEQTPTKVYFPNEDAVEREYVDGLGLRPREYALVSRELAAGSRQFLLRQGRHAVVCALDLAGFDAELKVISGRSASVARLHALMERVGSDPGSWLPLFMEGRSL